MARANAPDISAKAWGDTSSLVRVEKIRQGMPRVSASPVTDFESNGVPRRSQKNPIPAQMNNGAMMETISANKVGPESRKTARGARRA